MSRVFEIIGLIILANAVVMPWIVVWKVYRLAKDVRGLEHLIYDVMFNLDDDGGGGPEDDPDPEPKPIEDSTVVVFGKKVA